MERGKLRQIARNRLSQRCFMRILDTDIVGRERKMKIIRECVIDEKAAEQELKASAQNWCNAKNRETLMVVTSLENYALTFFYRSICRHVAGIKVVTIISKK